MHPKKEGGPQDQFQKAKFRIEGVLDERSQDDLISES